MKLKPLPSFISIVLLALPIAGLAIGCSETQTNSAQEVTFEQLFTRPNQYDGKLITIEGFYFQGFEVNVLCEKLEYSGYAPGHLIPKGRMVWVEGVIPQEVFDRLNQQQMLGPTERYGKVRVIGKFEYGGKYGHLGGYNFQIETTEVKLLPWA